MKNVLSSSHPTIAGSFPINLWNNQAPRGRGIFKVEDTKITVYRPQKPNGTAVIVLPGGGYGMLVADLEGHGVATWLNEHGITAVVLEYRLPEGDAFVPLLDAQRALRVVRNRAREWQIDPDRVGFVGFSAGGHLAASAGTLFGKISDPAYPHESDRPDFIILVYPLISLKKFCHSGSIINLLGSEAAADLLTLFSLEEQVTSKTPPAFLAHAVNDKIVSSMHSELFTQALRSCGVEARYLELPDGGHGFNDKQGPSWEAWKVGSLKWLEENGFMARQSGEALS